MLSANNITLQYGKRVLFDEVNIKFNGDNCYGIIGANGAGKSTFLKILSGEIDANKGSISMEPGKRMAVLTQSHSEFDDFRVIDAVMVGHKTLWEVMKEKDAVYAKTDFSEQDGIKAAELEEQFAEMDGWNAEPDAASLLSGLGIKVQDHEKQMKDMNGNQKVRILLAQAIFGNPDFLILDEPTNDLDVVTLNVLENFLLDYPGNLLVVSHDRYFMDKIVDALFVFRGEGVVENFPGNYSDFRAYDGSAPKEIAEKPDAKTAATKTEKKATKNILTFNEKREFGALEGDIERLQKKKLTIETAFLNVEIAPEDISKKSKELQETIEGIEEKEERWLELTMKLED